MKKLFNAVINCERKTIGTTRQSKIKESSLYCFILLFGILLFACNKQDVSNPNSTTQESESNAYLKSVNTRDKALVELGEAREATAKYQDINNAIADGYVDINLVMPNMGYHYEKASLVDSVFDIKKPELLVYN